MNTQNLRGPQRIDRRGVYDSAVHEMLLHDVYEIPTDPGEPAFLENGRVLCTCCGETGDRVEAIRHEPWCIYVNGPVCPSIPN